MPLEQKPVSEMSFHLAGIVPVAGQPLNYKFPWHDSLMPIAPDYLAVERAVVECAYAGCETIWVVCNDDMQPLIRHRLGDVIYDPVLMGRKFSSIPADERKPITIYYVPIHPKDRDKRDCLAWSVLYGALSAYSISNFISKWVTPDRYYAAFPYGVYEPEILRKHRKAISSRRDFFLSYKDKTVREGEYLGFTFDADGFFRYRDSVRREGTGVRVPGQQGIPTENLPLEKRWSARFFSLDKVFKSAKIEEAIKIELPWYKKIDSWETFCAYAGSPESEKIFRPAKCILSYGEWNPIGVDNE